MNFGTFSKKKTNTKNSKTWHRDPIRKNLLLCDYKNRRQVEAELPTLRFLKSLVLADNWY